MRTATITEVKNGLSALIDQVRAGETILITDRGLPVARLESVTITLDPTGRLGRLERAGIIRAGGESSALDRLRRQPHRLPAGVSAVRAVIEERRSGR